MEAFRNTSVPLGMLSFVSWTVYGRISGHSSGRKACSALRDEGGRNLLHTLCYIKVQWCLDLVFCSAEQITCLWPLALYESDLWLAVLLWSADLWSSRRTAFIEGWSQKCWFRSVILFEALLLWCFTAVHLSSYVSFDLQRVLFAGEVSCFSDVLGILLVASRCFENVNMKMLTDPLYLANTAN